MFNKTYTFKKTIVQILGAQKLLVFKPLDYPTKVTPNFNSRKTFSIQSFAQKKILKKYDWSIIGHYVFTFSKSLWA
jgi:hypothetical protein